MERPFPPPSFLPGPDQHGLAALLVGNAAVESLHNDDFTRFIQLAQNNGVATVLYWQLARMGVDLGAPEWKPLRAANDRAVRHYLKLKAAFLEIHAAFLRAAIPAIWLKGFALAHTVYPNPLLRSMRDLDVLVPHAQRQLALACAQSLGYALDMPPHLEVMQEMWHHYHLRRDVILEVHYGLFGFRSKVFDWKDVDWFRGQTRTVQLGDLTFLALNPEAELLYLCAHAILQHGEFQFLLHRYLDLHFLIQSNPQLDWQLIVERAAESRWTYAVARALETTREYFGTPLPAGIIDELNARRPADEDLTQAFVIRPDSTRVQATRDLMRGMNRTEKWIWLWGSLLPTAAYMRWRYPMRADWQLPLLYVYRWWVIAAAAGQAVLKWLHH